MAACSACLERTSPITSFSRTPGHSASSDPAARPVLATRTRIAAAIVCPPITQARWTRRLGGFGEVAEQPVPRVLEMPDDPRLGLGFVAGLDAGQHLLMLVLDLVER